MLLRQLTARRAAGRVVSLAILWLAAVLSAPRTGHADDERPSPTPTAATASTGSPPPSPRRWWRRPKIDSFGARFTYFHQEGTGYQSQAGPPEGPGSARMRVYQPAFSLSVLGFSPRVRHDFVGTVDVVTAASVDAIDAVSSASRMNEAGDLSGTSSIAASDDDTVAIRYRGHIEEKWWSFSGGASYDRQLWSDNITVGVGFNGTYDIFSAYGIDGGSHGQAKRTTINANASYVQVLSPTTLGALSYGLTYQAGTLQAPWNSVPVLDDPAPGQDPIDTIVDGRTPEILPRKRLRHALAGQLNQHVPKTHTTFALDYRYYVDSFDLQAHTPQVEVFQRLHRQVYVRLGYRLHWQSGVRFSTRGVTHDTYVPGDAVTADADLERFFAHRVGIKGTFYIRPPRSGRGPPHWIDVGYSYYWRTNDLRVHIPTIGYGGRF